ncbi:MAG: discoidin domain-containing protein [Actinomycetota bacterium]|nr:discoidin domain-containing protein [Actinomycetota bacterium]
MQGDDRNDQFDDLFERFDLPDTPADKSTTDRPPKGRAQSADNTGELAVSQQHVTTSDQNVAAVTCPSCGAHNPAYNHHCERCGSRLNSDPMPIAPAPASRSSAGGRALGVLLAIVLLVALVALMMNIFGGDVAAGPSDPTETSSTTSSTVPQPAVLLVPSSVTASSFLSDSYRPENLIDGNPDTRWNDDGARGVGAWLEFNFATPVAITDIVFQNVEDDEAFKRNYKIQGYQIEVNDLNVTIPGRLQNSNEPQRVPIASLQTFKLRIEVTTTYLAQSAGELTPFTELALQGIEIYGVEN